MRGLPAWRKRVTALRQNTSPLNQQALGAAGAEDAEDGATGDGATGEAEHLGQAVDGDGGSAERNGLIGGGSGPIWGRPANRVRGPQSPPRAEPPGGGTVRAPFVYPYGL